MRNLLFLLVLCTFLFSSCKKDDNSPTGSNPIPTELEGTWKTSGNEVTIIFTNNTFDFKGSGNGISFYYSGTFTLKTNSNPKNIDMLMLQSNQAQDIGKTSLGIYKLQSNTLTLELYQPGITPRPTEFSDGGFNSFVLIKQ